MSCNCGQAEHKVWCNVRVERRRRKHAERPPPKQTAAQRREAEHRDMATRRARVKALYDAGVRGMGRMGA